MVWPILSGILALQIALGALVGYLERWPLGDGIYFAFITALTIGYGELIPSRFSTRIIAIAIGFAGILVTGLVAAVGVAALSAAMREDDPR